MYKSDVEIITSTSENGLTKSLIGFWGDEEISRRHVKITEDKAWNGHKIVEISLIIQFHWR